MSPPIPSSLTSYSQSPLADTSRGSIHQQQPSIIVDGRDSSGLDNAVLDSMHTSTTESVLQWPHFDVFPSLRTEYQSIFHLERSRPPLQLTDSTLFPYLDAGGLFRILASFEQHVNFWYPTVSQSQLQRTKEIMREGPPSEESLDSCLALLILALGCASQVTSDLTSPDAFSTAEVAKREETRRIGDVYFKGALRKLHIAHLSLNSTAAQCLFFIA